MESEEELKGKGDEWLYGGISGENLPKPWRYSLFTQKWRLACYSGDRVGEGDGHDCERAYHY